MDEDSSDNKGIHREKTELIKCSCGNEILTHIEAFVDSSFLARLDGAKLVPTDGLNYSDTIETVSQKDQ